MGLSFSNVNGAAKKGGEYMKLQEGENVFRIVGDVLPRYLYWVKSPENKSVPFECLAFNREKEVFDNVEKDWVQEYVKDKDGEPIKCSWAYAVQVINRETGKLEILNLKKKMFEALIKFCRDAELDPTDYEKGFNIVVDRVKTGSNAYNVEYNLNYVKMMKNQSGEPLSDKDRELIKDLKPIEEIIPRPSAEEQKKALLNHLSGKSDPSEEKSEDTSSGAEKEAINELDNV